ncbi:hypothetical protein NDA03_03185 [Trichocoleus sp. Lan]|uniref:hypothetical protein n=1 Tax=Trichocoleus sp. Lan TaxID=2933927 RepID=UPI003297D3D9
MLTKNYFHLFQEIEENEAFPDSCYTIVGNEAMKDFLEAELVADLLIMTFKSFNELLIA